MAEPRDINEKIGLDFLVKAGKLPQPGEDSPPEEAPSSESASAPAGAYEADIQAFAARAVLRSLQQHEQAENAQESGTRLSVISSDLGMSAEVLLPLSRNLENMGMLRTLERSTFGDNRVALTDKAREMLSANDDVELLQQLRSA